MEINAIYINCDPGLAKMRHLNINLLFYPRDVLLISPNYVNVTKPREYVYCLCLLFVIKQLYLSW